LVSYQEIAISNNAMPAYVVRSVIRSLDVLIALADLGRAATNAELSDRVGLHPATTLRMLGSLVSRQFLRQYPDGSYDLGSRVLDIGSAFIRRLSISRHANEIAQALADEVKETSSVGIRDEGCVLYIAIAHGQADLGIQSVPFARHPVYCTALGKALLGELPWSEVEELVQRTPMEKLTANTIIDLEVLKKDIKLSHSRGWAMDNCERTPGVICIAAPIRDFSSRIVAAVSISGPDFRIARHGVEKLADIVREAGQRASERLGLKDQIKAKAVGRKRSKQ
jgi:IclR family KDG regulon transcriptional repressor